MSVTVSVIVPVYNAEKYIRRCLECIITQTYKNLQIVLVDDGSDDNSYKICEEYAKKDNRIELYHKKNGGVVSARKWGVNQAIGEYIVQFDADDYIKNDYIEHLVSLAENYDADMVVVNHFHVIGDDVKVVHNGFDTGLYTATQLLDKLITTGEFFEYGIQPHIWNKMIRTRIVKKNQESIPDEIQIGDDAALVYPCVMDCNKIKVSDCCGYYYIQNPTSLSKNKIEKEEYRVKLLVDYLRMKFREKEIETVLEKQICLYRKYLMIMRNIGYYDRLDEHTVLVPYGGISTGSRVIIYGAGVLGKQLYRYICDEQHVSLVKWVDINWKVYTGFEAEIVSPNKILDLTDYDYILIANLSADSADRIKKYLSEISVDMSKVRWFDDLFIYGKE